MPQAPAGTRGYTDFQRIDNYDSGSQWAVNPGVTNVNQVSPIIDCSRYAYLCGLLACTTASMEVQIRWYLDPAGTVLIGTQTLRIDSNIPSPAQIRIINLGPFVQVSLSSFTGGAYTPSADILLSNRGYPLQLVPSVPMLIDRQNVAIVSNTTAFVYPFDYCAGPVGVWLNVSAGPFAFTFEHLLTTGAWDDFDQFTAPTGSSRFTTVIPPGAWRVQVDNDTPANQTFYLAVTPSLTGGT